MRNKPICFIAMAFNRDDTDRLYKNLILPVLNKNNITPVIVNRIESNDDLNIQIISQLERCDFVIADLTYARPSVYFEAGFAQRKAEVIYTVRKDHLNLNNPDDLRVHFDLSMKNIIVWADENDKRFMERIEKRIKATFLDKWIIEKEKDNELTKQRNDFSAQPQDNRIRLLKIITIKKILSLNVKNILFGSFSSYYKAGEKKNRINTGNFINLLMYRNSKVAGFVFTVNVFNSAYKSDLVRIKQESDPYRVQSFAREMNFAEKIYINQIIISLRKIPQSRVQDVFSEFTLFNKNVYVYETDCSFSRMGKEYYYRIIYFLHIISPILSTEEYEKSLALNLKLTGINYRKPILI